MPDSLNYVFDFFGILEVIAPQIFILTIIHDTREFEDVQVLGDVRLCGLKEVFDVVDTFFTVQENFHDMKAGGMRQGF
jgi:hypothetical protein